MEIENKNLKINSIFIKINKILNLSCVDMSAKFHQDMPILPRDIACQNSTKFKKEKLNKIELKKPKFDSIFTKSQ